MSNQSSRRPRRGGGNRNSQNRNRGGNRNNRNRSTKPKKLSFWDKVKAFFKGGNDTTTTGYRSTPGKTEKPKERRKPEKVEVTSPRLYVGNLSYDATESDLENLFNGAGTVQDAEVVTNRHTQRSKGFAFVEMQSIEEAKRAVDELHDQNYMGRKLVVSGAKSKAA